MSADQASVGLAALGWVFTAVLLLVLIICAAAGRGWLTRNPVAGLRLPALMRSDEAWRSGHAAGVVPATIALAAAAGGSIAGLWTPWMYWASVAVFVAGIVWVVAAASRAANASIG